MKTKKLKLKISNWKLVTIIIAFVIAVCTAQNGTAAEMKSAGWPDAGVVWTTAETTNYWVDSYYTNFPTSSSTGMPFKAVLNINLSKKEIKRAAKIKKRVSKQKTITPGWPTEFGPYYQGRAYKHGSSYETVVPAGMYTDGEDYFIVYNVNAKSYVYESMYANYDSSNWKYIDWRERIETQSSQAYVQKIDKNGNLISELGIPVTSGADYEKYSLYYRRDGINYSTNYINGGIAGASLVDCGKNLLISGQRTKPGIGWRAKPEVIEGGIYYVLSNSLEKLEWPSWCSGKFVGLSSGHKTSGRENKYIHAFGGDSGKRVWRLLPR